MCPAIEVQEVLLKPVQCFAKSDVMEGMRCQDELRDRKRVKIVLYKTI